MNTDLIQHLKINPVVSVLIRDPEDQVPDPSPFHTVGKLMDSILDCIDISSATRSKRTSPASFRSRTSHGVTSPAFFYLRRAVEFQFSVSLLLRGEALVDASFDMIPGTMGIMLGVYYVLELGSVKPSEEVSDDRMCHDQRGWGKTLGAFRLCLLRVRLQQR